MSKTLIVEDDAITRDILAAAMEAMGHVPVLSPDGRHALSTIECDPKIALVITDMLMPIMDGRALIKAIRARYAKLQKRAPPILIMSGVVGPREIADLLDEGAEAFLPKPVNLAEMREYVDRAMCRA